MTSLVDVRRRHGFDLFTDRSRHHAVLCKMHQCRHNERYGDLPFPRTTYTHVDTWDCGCGPCAKRRDSPSTSLPGTYTYLRKILDQMESGQHAVPPPLAQAMTRMYGQPDSDVLIMARLVRHRGQVTDFAAWNLDQLSWESCSTRVCEVAATHIPELLQTSAYARAVFASHAQMAFAWQIRCAFRGAVAQQSIRTGLAALALRQDRLTGPPLVPMHVVITESALRAQLAAPRVMIKQWARLTTVAARCAVTVRVLPRAHSRLIGAQHGWRMLEFSNTPEPRWLFRRYGNVNAPTEGQEEAATAYRKFLRLRAACLSADDSQTFIQQLIHGATLSTRE